MADQSGDDIVRAILAETERRRRVWAEMQAAAQDIVAAVLREARRRGVTGRTWMFDAGENRTSVNVYLHSFGSYIFYISAVGNLTPWGTKEAAYEGYPEFPDAMPEAFKNAAAEALMARLNGHIAKRNH